MGHPELCCNNPNNMPLDKDFWENKYQNNEAGWDMGKASPPLMEYMQQVEDKDISILIPGAGNAYEIQALLDLGFTNITVIDIAQQPINTKQKEFSENPFVKMIHGDFFQHQGNYDVILEQTFFCALPIQLRVTYVQKMYELLNEKGTLAGLLFNRTFENPGPPFGGNILEYKSLFRGLFTIKTMETAYNSIPERANTEVFFIIKKINALIKK